MRRKRLGRWLPPDPYNSVAVGTLDDPISNTSQNIVKFVTFDLPAAKGSGFNINIPLVGDFNQDIIAGTLTPLTPGGNPGGTLADVSVGYSLARVVGKLFIAPERDNLSDIAASAWMFTAGMIVRRTNEAGVPTALDTYTDAYSATTDPWLWRRSWILGSAANARPFEPLWPANNTQYGSVLDGPHVDAKTRRTVKAEERLFMDISVVALNGTDDQVVGVAYAYWDFRFFGKVFTSAGNRNNASR